MPAPVGPIVAQEARDLALAVAAGAGDGRRPDRRVLPDGRRAGLLVNEIAPRPHNSGHLTIEAAVVQPVRAAGPGPLRPARWAATDLVDARRDGQPARRPLGRRRARLGGRACVATRASSSTSTASGPPAPGRKMGHLTVLDPDPDAALARALGRAGRWSTGVVLIPSGRSEERRLDAASPSPAG